MPPLSTCCNEGMENERKNLEVDDFLVVLPQDVWELIIKKLHLVDYLRFGAVSKLWRSVAVAAKESPYFSLSPQLPWLVLSSNEGDVPDGYHGFFSLCHQKILKLKLPEMSGARCCGSSFGWLIMENKVNDTFLFHPFLSLQIQLPSQTTLPAARPQHSLSIGWKWGPLYIRKAILTSSPTSSNCFVVALYARQHVCFCRPGDKAWRVLEWTEPNLFEDVRCYNGRLYAVRLDFSLVILELEGSHPRGTKINLCKPVGDDVKPHYNYLMESPGGELLMIVRNRTYFPVRNGRFTKTVGFYIFKLGGLKDSPSWIRVESLGDEMLFVGTSGAISVPATNFSSGLFKGNCIYFTDDHFATLTHIPLSFGCHDWCVQLGGWEYNVFLPN